MFACFRVFGPSSGASRAFRPLGSCFGGSMRNYSQIRCTWKMTLLSQVNRILTLLAAIVAALYYWLCYTPHILASARWRLWCTGSCDVLMAVPHPYASAHTITRCYIWWLCLHAWDRSQDSGPRIYSVCAVISKSLPHSHKQRRLLTVYRYVLGLVRVDATGFCVGEASWIYVSISPLPPSIATTTSSFCYPHCYSSSFFISYHNFHSYHHQHSIASYVAPATLAAVADLCHLPGISTHLCTCVLSL